MEIPQVEPLTALFGILAILSLIFLLKGIDLLGYTIALAAILYALIFLRAFIMGIMQGGG